ncbi:MAG: carbamoyl-phosphate synthase large subunit [Candidatus Acetothermia bacterium]
MSKRRDLEKVLLIGSGPIQIGQAAEFDYSGSQACKAFQEEGVKVVLVNSNPATIMTDPEMADSVYIEPLEPSYLKEIIKRENPDGIAAGLGGQTGLNLTVELHEDGFLEQENVEVLGTPIQTVYDCEDRAKFKKKMSELDEQVPRSKATNSVDEALQVAEDLGYPLVVRPAYTLGGAGGGMAYNAEQLKTIAGRGLSLSRIDQVLVEESVIGWKEFEYEVMRDGNDTTLTVINMENVDPMGIHTGESIVVAPSQTLSDKEHQRLRFSAIKIIRALGVEGGCNIQFAVEPQTGNYRVVEVNPRVSRSSALASKATGYPIARVAAKIALGMTLENIPNDVTKRTPAAFEPAVDYVVVKIPRWPFEKFPEVDSGLTTQMKSTGETMAIGRTVEEALQKAIRSSDTGRGGISSGDRQEWQNDEEVRQYLKKPTHKRIFAIYQALQRGVPLEEIAASTKIDQFWLRKIQSILQTERSLTENETEDSLEAKRKGFSREAIKEATGNSSKPLKAEDSRVTYKMVDTCAGEFRASTPYYYSTYEARSELKSISSTSRGPNREKKKALILGGGPIRIGQGIEFDYCCVHAVQALRDEGVETLMVNNNPETVSTDYDTADKLFFEPLTPEDVMQIIRAERPDGVLVQFGGQTSVNLALPLQQRLSDEPDLPTEIWGTTAEFMDAAEDRDRFHDLLNELNITTPQAETATSRQEALKIGEQIGFPLLVRPSYVIGGRGMKVVRKPEELQNYLEEAVQINPQHPVLIDQFLEGATEIDIDAVSDGKDVLIGGVMEHIEYAGVHSGDSACVLPPQSLSERQVDRASKYVKRIARELKVKGLLNVQLAAKGDEIFVLEANPRASRTIPFLSKATGVPLAKIAARTMAGRKLAELKYPMSPNLDHVAVKEVVFPFSNLPEADPILGPEMKSIGEVMGVSEEFPEAFYKAELAAGNRLPQQGKVLLSISDEEKEDVLPLAEKLRSLGLPLAATPGTGRFLQERGLEVHSIARFGSSREEILKFLKEEDISLIVNTPTKGETPQRGGYKIRRASVDLQIPCITEISVARAAVDALKNLKKEDHVTCNPIASYHEVQR